MFHLIFQGKHEIPQIGNYYIAFRSSNVDIQNFHFIKLSNAASGNYSRDSVDYFQIHWSKFTLPRCARSTWPDECNNKLHKMTRDLNFPRQWKSRLLWSRPFSNVWRSASRRIRVSGRWKRRSTWMTRSKVDACASLIIRQFTIIVRTRYLTLTWEGEQE